MSFKIDTSYSAASDFITKSWVAAVGVETTAGVSQWLLIQHRDKNI